MLGDISGLERIYIVCGYTDMRKSIDGLCAVVEEQLKLDPASSSLFLFCGRRRDRIKALYRDADGFVLIYKKLTVLGFHHRNGGFLKNGFAVSYPRTAGTRRPNYSATQSIDEKA